MSLYVHNTQGEQIATCTFAEDAACLVALYGEGASIRNNNGVILWNEGREDQEAGNSYDHVASVVWKRFDQAKKETLKAVRLAMRT